VNRNGRAPRSCGTCRFFDASARHATLPYVVRDMSFTPASSRREPWWRAQRLPILAALLAVNAGVILLHGDPRTQLAASRHSPTSASAATPPASSPGEIHATPVEAPFAPTIDPLAGARRPGRVQHVLEVSIQSGQSAAVALSEAGVAREEIAPAILSLKNWVDFRHLRAGHHLIARLDEDNHLVSLDVVKSAADQFRTDREEDEWQGRPLNVPINTVVAKICGSVKSSLWEAVVSQGGDARLVGDIVDIFAWDLDFYSEIYPGDTYRVLVEKQFAHDQFVGFGTILAAEIVSAGTIHRAFVNPNQDKKPIYYDEQGQSLRKQLLRSPLKYANVTSEFGMRVHPILGYTRNHNGIDYGAPIGTPVWSVGDGHVTFAGWQPGYGRIVQIHHANGWVSEYGHLSAIHVKPGQHVTQKDIIALTGNSGLSTGPHLHYGLVRYGAFVNPTLQNFERGAPLTGAALSSFHEQVKQLLSALDAMPVAGKDAANHGTEG
jgi:murein DD-endopeptidase MepM/ murein hydrolase activator NlpD